jgi:ubiquinol-cytochrome c reductase cytochrome b subunit
MAKEKRKEGIPFYPNYALEDLRVFLVFFFVYMAVVFFMPSIFSPDTALQRANPLDTPAHVKPEWYFLASYQILKLMPTELTGILVQMLVGAVLFFLPFLDRSSERHPAKRPVFTTIAVLALLGAIGLSIWGHYS